MGRKIPVTGGDELVYQGTFKCTEEEVDELLQTINDLAEMAKFDCQYLRHKLEKCNPALVGLLQKFLVLELARMESLLEISQMLNVLMKEFWAVKYSGKEGEA
jgi:hypothetical protein